MAGLFALENMCTIYIEGIVNRGLGYYFSGHLVRTFSLIKAMFGMFFIYTPPYTISNDLPIILLKDVTKYHDE